MSPTTHRVVMGTQEPLGMNLHTFMKEKGLGGILITTTHVGMEL